MILFTVAIKYILYFNLIFFSLEQNFELPLNFIKESLHLLGPGLESEPSVRISQSVRPVVVCLSICLQIYFRMIILVRIGHTSLKYHASLRDDSNALGSKCQRSKSQVRVVYICLRIRLWMILLFGLVSCIQTSHMYHSSLRECPLLILDSKG